MKRIFIDIINLDISGKIVRVSLYRNESGNLEWIPINSKIFESGEFLEDGHCTEGYNQEIIIKKFIP